MGHDIGKLPNFFSSLINKSKNGTSFTLFNKLQKLIFGDENNLRGFVVALSSSNSILACKMIKNYQPLAKSVKNLLNRP
jgi:hypothetical protein